MVLKLVDKQYRFLFWLCVVVIFILAIMPLKMPQFNASFGDKVNHIVAFLVLFFLLDKSYNFKILMRCCILIGYGLFIEIVQSFLPYRTFSLLDLCADGIGLILGLCVKKILLKNYWSCL